MVILPFVLGWIEAWRAGSSGWAHLTLFGFWLFGYCAFHAASGWLKSPPTRRNRYVAPLAAYATVSAFCGVATLSLAGLQLLWWVPVFLPLVVPALWLARRRRERSTTGGLLTVVAAALMLPVARYLYPQPVDDWPTVAAIAGLVGGYFFGTVLFVKTNIRERGSRAYLVASLVYHFVLLLVATGLAWAKLAAWWWVPVMAFVLVRAVVVPPMKLRPLPLGLIEVCVCLAILLGSVIDG